MTINPPDITLFGTDETSHRRRMVRDLELFLTTALRSATVDLIDQCHPEERSDEGSPSRKPSDAEVPRSARDDKPRASVYSSIRLEERRC